MSNLDLYTSFLRGTNTIDSEDRPSTAECEQFLNLGKDKYIETRFTGMNSKRESFEETQKRVDDLRDLIDSVEYDNTSIVTLLENQQLLNGNKWSKYRVVLPDDYWHFIKDDLYTQPICGTSLANCWLVNDGLFVDLFMETTDVTKDTLNRHLTNSLAPHLFKYGSATLLRMISNDNIEIYTDGTYKPSKYEITYLKQAPMIDVQTFLTMKDEWTGLPKHTHREIVQILVNLWLASKGGPTLQPQAQMEAVME